MKTIIMTFVLLVYNNHTTFAQDYDYFGGDTAGIHRAEMEMRPELPPHIQDRIENYHYPWEFGRKAEEPLHPFFGEEYHDRGALILSNRVQEEWVSHYNSELLPGSASAEAVVTDADGNIYITGSITKSPFGNVCNTIKYNSFGTELWSVCYDVGIYNSASAIAVDADKNVYVTGRSYNSGSDYDFITLKYDIDGKQQWVAYYNGFENAADYATALIVDTVGNVYVTGYSQVSGMNYDYATVKYNIDGVQQWLTRYDGPGNAFDIALGIAVDTDENVYVTGASTGVDTQTDFATIKYNTSGTPLWTARYNGSGNDYDGAIALTLDKSRNVYITGSSYDSLESYYTTIKYDNAGNQQWVVSYENPENTDTEAKALAVDRNGNVYVTGHTYSYPSQYDIVTVHYNSDGVLQWAERYNSPDNGDDYSKAMTLDASGNIYVTGYTWRIGYGTSYTTLKYDTSGVQQWVVNYNGASNYDDRSKAIAVDNFGNAYVTGISWNTDLGFEYATVKINPAGIQEWETHCSGARTSQDRTNAMAVDAAGYIYITGSNARRVRGHDFSIIKYDTDGNKVWKSTYSAPWNDFPIVSELEIDAFGNIYIGSSIADSSYNQDFCILKYDINGTLLWDVRYNGPENKCDYLKALEVDTDGNVYVTGVSCSNSGNDNYYTTLKYDPDGLQQWVANYNGTGNGSDLGTALAVDTDGNVYVTGTSYDSNTNYDYATIKYNTNGLEEWVARYNGPGNYIDKAMAMVIDVSGNIYVTGTSSGSGTARDFATIKYNSSGTEEWVARYNGPRSSINESVTLALDDNGNIYVAGDTWDQDTGINYALVRYDANGNQLWEATYNGLGDGNDRTKGLVIDARGNAYITGTSNGSFTNNDYATIKYDANGNEQWVAIYNTPRNSDDHLTAIALDGSNNVFVTGYSNGNGINFNGSIYTTVKYNQTSTSMMEIPLETPENYSLSQNFPNPFNPSTTIAFTLPQPATVQLDIFDLNGRLVTTIADGSFGVGRHQSTWDGSAANGEPVASGVYFCRLSATVPSTGTGAVYTQTRKMLLMR